MRSAHADRSNGLDQGGHLHLRFVQSGDRRGPRRRQDGRRGRGISDSLTPSRLEEALLLVGVIRISERSDSVGEGRARQRSAAAPQLSRTLNRRGSRLAFLRRWEPHRLAPDEDILLARLDLVSADEELPETPASHEDVYRAVVRASTAVNRHIRFGCFANVCVGRMLRPRARSVGRAILVAGCLLPPECRRGRSLGRAGEPASVSPKAAGCWPRFALAPATGFGARASHSFTNRR